MIWWVALLSVLLYSPADASCSGTGSTQTCTAGSTAAQINTAIGTVGDQGVVTLQNGTYSTTGISFSNMGNGLSLQCESVGGCLMTGAGNVFSSEATGCPASNVTNLFRITGFSFTSTTLSGTARIFIYCNVNILKLRLDHNDFVYAGGVFGMALGASSPASSGVIYGVIDHNNCHGVDNYVCLKHIAGASGDTWRTGQQGGADAIFFEDNICNFDAYTDTGSGCVDAWRGVSFVFRYNTLTNSRMVNHSLCHGGPYNSEAYGNVINNAAFASPNYRNLHFQGSGEIIVFNNQVEDAGGAFEVQNFRSDSSTATTEGSCNSLADGTVTGTGADPAHANDGNRSPTGTYRGYPTWHQAGRDKDAALKPIYAWNNRTAGGTLVPLRRSTAGFYNEHFAANRDYYDGVSASAQSSSTSPFNGTVGTGFGTLANRPTTCTPTSESLDAGNGGVGYFATDQGAQGTLYRCSATNTWTVHYTPYTYPHPLQGVVAYIPGTSTSGAVSVLGRLTFQ